MFGGSAEPWTASEEKQPKLADTTLLQFSKCIHKALSQPCSNQLITMHWYVLGACRYYNNYNYNIYISHSECVESSGQIEWKLQSVVDNTQIGSLERFVEKMKLARKEAEGERDRAMEGKPQAEGERDRAMEGKQQAEGERDRAMAGIQRMEGERDRAMAGIQQAEGERDRAMAGIQRMEGERDRALAGIQQAEGEMDRAMAGIQRIEGERDRAMAGKKQAEGERDRAMEGKQQVEGERDRAMSGIQRVEGEGDRALERAQLAETRANDLQRRLNEVEGREHERLVVQEQAIAAEQRGPSWEVKEEDLRTLLQYITLYIQLHEHTYLLIFPLFHSHALVTFC